MVAVIAVLVVGIGLTILVVVPDSKPSSTSISTSPSTSTGTASPAPSTVTQAPGPVADYLKKNNIQATTIVPGAPGSPKIDLPVPEDWTPIPERPEADYFGIVFTKPTNPDDPPRITASVEKLTGNVDVAQLLAATAHEVQDLPGYSGSDCQESRLSDQPACQLGGTYTKDGVTRAVAQKAAVIQRADGVYVLRINADGLQDDTAALNAAAGVIDDKTTIAP
jgi:hypothetical protein